MAKNVIGQYPGGEKIPIAELVPLDTPLVFQIFPIYACNFSCSYCTFSVPKNKRQFISGETTLDFNLYKKCLDDLLDFPQKVKVFRFVGMGEPLLHKQLPEMIYEASERNISKRIEIITNASLLNEELSLKLINSGLTHLLISVQGISAEKYLEISGKKIDFNKFIENIKFFFLNRKNVKVYIKIADISLLNEREKEKYFDIFNPICDTIGIENIGPIFDGVTLNKELKLKEQNQFGVEREINTNICSLPFYFMQINPDGNIVPCYSVTYPIILGNCKTQTLKEIWNGKKYNNFRLEMLNGMHKIKICNICNIFKHRMGNSDNLNNKVDFLKKIYSPLK